MSRPEIGVIMPLFVVRNVPRTLSFYRDRLGFAITFEGPEPNDVFFGMVKRGHAEIMFKDIGVEPVPNHTKDIAKGHAPWDAYIWTPEPDALAEEFRSRGVDLWREVSTNDDNLRGFEVQDVNGYVLYFGTPVEHLKSSAANG